MMSSTTRPSRNRLREQQAAATRERIVDALAELAVEGHLLDVPIRDVAARAGVSEPTVYRHFGSRDGLLEALASRQFRQITEGIEPTSVDDLARAVSTVFERATSSQDLIRWTLASPMAAGSGRAQRSGRPPMIAKTTEAAARGLSKGDHQNLELVLLVLPSPLVYLYLHDLAGIDHRRAADVASWAIMQLANSVQAENRGPARVQADRQRQSASNPP